MQRQQQQQGLDIQRLQQAVRTRWLKPREVLDILQNSELFGIHNRTPQRPPSGSWFLFNRRVHRFFRNDGYVDNVKALNCYYARAENNPRLMRRIYWMLEPAYEHIVLVHYRDVLEGSISVSVLSGSPTSNQNGSASRADAHSSPGLTSEIIATSQLLSLENKERHDVNTDEVLPNHDPIHVHGIQNEELDACINLADVFELDHAEGSHPYPDPIDDALIYSGTCWDWEDDQLNSILHPASVTVDENRRFHIHDVSPEWAFCSESAKVVIAGDFPSNPSNSSWVLFGDFKNSEGEYLLPKQYHGVIHTIAALGYDWALEPLLSSGVPINFRDANGWTALHWAARFGRKQMVAVLLTAGAAVGALSDPTAEDPAAKTPASIAYTYGFKGLSAFLSEAELTSTLHSLESKENGNLVDHNGGVSISSAVDRISDKCAHVDGGTDDQLALKDSLGAIRNAVQAAGRIQATFRVFSLEKKKQKALQNGDSSASPSIIARAALSIQKNFRCWKKRKEFQRIRKNVIKIQARFRAHRERNKYKELLQSVGILEKIMLRWFRKGVGLRGISSRAMPIDQDEEEDIVRVFRKERVETAVSEAVSRVSAIVGCPVARLDYRKMLEIHQQAKVGHGK
ncbi:hypothetical protein ZWY2020_027459 [Hordeum vulgare]|nr:hypothetical protein ZWY2020_027459 [Hordeum vulgare]